MANQINPDDILAMAKRLIKHYGKQALGVAKQRADEAELGTFPSNKDIALLVLTQVEILLGVSG